jgi:glycosyltransferase involved in cell wall biosynthesis
VSEKISVDINLKEGEKHRKKILFITPSVQMEKSSGGGIVTNERLSALVQHHDVDVLTMKVDSAARQCFSGVNWHVCGLPRPRSVGVLFNSFLEGLPLSVWRNTVSGCVKAAKKLNDNQWDMVYVDHWLMIEVAFKTKSEISIINLHNAEPEVFFRAYYYVPLVQKLFVLLEGYRSAAYLRKTISRFSELHLLSHDDAQQLKARGISHSHTRVFLPTVKPSDINPAPFEKRQHEVLFVGTLSWHANEEGLMWYIEKVVDKLVTVMRHQIIGAGASDKIITKAKKFPEITFRGYVVDLEPVYQSAKCLVAPLLSGSGVKIKIINALARGLPVVTTSIGVEGFPSGYQGAIFVADTPEQFAMEIENLTNDKQLWSRANKKAAKYFSENFSGNAWRKWAETLTV